MEQVFYTQRADGRFYETMTFMGTARAGTWEGNVHKVKHYELEELPQDYQEKILMLLAAGADMEGVGVIMKGRCVYAVQGEHVIEHVVYFGLRFPTEGGTDDTHRRVERRGVAHTISFV